MKPIYLDHAASTPLCDEAREAMVPWLSSEFGNPSSLHQSGRRAKEAIDQAREVISTAFDCLFGEVIFTSGGTESAVLGIVGTALAALPDRRRVLLSAAEHHCVLGCQEILERLGFQVDLVPVDRVARVRLDVLEEMMGPDVLLVAVMHANNELGTFNDVSRAAEIAHRAGALLFVDAVQTFPFCRQSETGADMISSSAHKIYGPKGAGALYVRSGTKIKPVVAGGGQEREMRAGTENVAGIVGFAAAAQMMIDTPLPHAQSARDLFHFELAGLTRKFVPSVPDRDQLMSHFHIRFPGISADTMLVRLDREGICASSGAACSSGSLEPSHVLQACGYSEAESNEGLRFTFGKDSTDEEAVRAARIVAKAAEEVLAKRQAR